MKKYKIAVIQRICPDYRFPLFYRLQRERNFNFKYFFTNGIKGTKLQNSKKINYLNKFVSKNKGFMLNLLKKRLPIVYHYGIFQELDKFKPDLIIYEGGFSNFITNLHLIYYIRKKRIKSVHWSLGLLDLYKSNVIYKILKKLFLSWYYRYDINSCKAMFSYSKAGKISIQNNYPNKKVYVIYNSKKHSFNDKQKFKIKIDELKSIAKDKKILLYIGYISYEKEIKKLLRIYLNLKKNNDILLFIVGEGKDKKKLMSLYKKSEGIFWFNKTEIIEPFLYSSYLFILPGLGGLSAQDAIASGLPVVMSKGDGTERDLIINNYNGILLTDSSIDSYCNAIQQLLDNKDLYKSMRNNCKLDNTKFSIQAMSNNMLSAIEDIINE